MILYDYCVHGPAFMMKFPFALALALALMGAVPAPAAAQEPLDMAFGAEGLRGDDKTDPDVRELKPPEPTPPVPRKR